MLLIQQSIFKKSLKKSCSFDSNVVYYLGILCKYFERNIKIDVSIQNCYYSASAYQQCRSRHYHHHAERKERESAEDPFPHAAGEKSDFQILEPFQHAETDQDRQSDQRDMPRQRIDRIA